MNDRFWEVAVLQSILAALGILMVLFFFVDIRRKAQGHSRAVQQERDAIAELTQSTAILSSFTEGPTTVLLGASEDHGLFFYRRLDMGKLVLHHNLRLANLVVIALQINGEVQDFHFTSTHLSAQMRATDISRQARQAITQENLAKIKHIRLNIFFRSDDGKEKNLPVTIYRAPQRGGMEVLAKSFENAVWWKSYLAQIAQRKSEKDTLTFQDPPSRETEEDWAEPGGRTESTRT